jgi:tetratricopeptide (TPR) repeat protein
MGMSYDEAKRALMDITGLSIDELERRVNEIEEEIKKLEEKIELFRQEVLAGIVTADVGEFAKGRIYPNIKVENGELRVRVEDGYHSIVRAGKFNELVNEVRDRLLKQGFVVVVGPKGIGKSTLAAAVIWELFMNGDIGLVAHVDVLNEDNYPRFKTFIENYSEELVKYFGRLLILYDPVSTETYEREPSTQQGRGALTKTGEGVRRVRYVKMPRDVEVTIANLINASSELGDLRPPILIVLPSDVYNALSEEVRNELEVYRLDVSQGLINTELLAELIREYTRTKSNPNGCALSDRELSELAGELAKFDSGHALIARLIGEELARNNCSAREIKELINNAKGKAEAFIILHINGLFKVHEDPDTAKALVEIFALRRPFVDLLRPGVPILTQGIVGLIGEERGAKILYGAEGGELRGWLAHRQHDLIEEVIKKLLKCIVSEGEECKELGDALEPWKTKGVMESLMKVSEKVSDVGSAVEYFVGNYGEKLTNTLKVFSNECWKRAALIIGYALTGRVSVHRPEDLPESLRGNVAESLGNALNRCGVDDYLLVGNVIPPLIRYLTFTRVSTEAFIDKYNEAVAEVNRILNIAKNRGDINDTESFYGLGLASIIANAARLGKVVKPGDADIALRIASFTIKSVALPILIKPVLDALEPFRDKAPHRYLDLLAVASGMVNLDPITVRYIFAKLNEILDNYGDVVRGYAWPLVYAIHAYVVLLRAHIGYFNRKEIGDVVGRVVDLLKELGKFKTSLGVIAWAVALAPALEHGYVVRRLIEEKLGIDALVKVNEVLEKLNDMRERVQELMRDEEFMGYIESRFVKADEKAVKIEILDTASLLKQALAHYRFDNNELDEAEELFNEAAEERREIGDYQNYLAARGWALRVEAIKGSLVGDELTKLVDGFRRLYEETFNKKAFMRTAMYLSMASATLSNYLVSLALKGDHETINKLLEEHLWVLNADKEVSVLTRLTLNALLGHRVELSSELKGRLSVNPEELIDAFGYIMSRNYLPALRVAFGMISPEEGYEGCKSIEDSTERRDCEDAVLGVMDDSVTIWRIRGALIKYFNERILEIERSGWLRELGFDANALISEFGKLVYGLDGKSLAQLLAIYSSTALPALMLHALINGNKELAKALALKGAIYYSSKLLGRLFLEAYKECKECCDLGSEGFRRAIARLFFYHI